MANSQTPKKKKTETVKASKPPAELKETVRLNVELDRPLYKYIKIKAIENDTTISGLLRSILEEWRAKR